jgi:hypothetical protein
VQVLTSLSTMSALRCGLCQGDFTVEVQPLFGAEFEGHAASGSDPLDAAGEE